MKMVMATGSATAMILQYIAFPSPLSRGDALPLIRFVPRRPDAVTLNTAS